MKNFLRYFLAVSVTCLLFVSFAHQSMKPLLFGRYSIGYAVFLVLMALWSVFTWSTVLKRETYARLQYRIRRLPLFRLCVLGGSLFGLVLVFWQNSYDSLLLIGLNKNIIGVAAVITMIIALSLLSSKQVDETLTNYAVLAGTCCIMFLGLELGSRIIGYYKFDMFTTLTNTDYSVPKAGEAVRLGRIIRPHENPRIIYELIPNISVIFREQPVSINLQGFRSAAHPPQKPERAIRIVGLGDSVMFGWGVKDHETYLARLSRILNDAYPDFSWEIVNTSVPGYNTAMEVETLKEKGLRFTPDIVLIEYVGNDFELPNFIRKKENYFSFQKSFFKQFIERQFGTSRVAKGLVDAPANFANGNFASNPENVPEEYHHMVGQDAYYAAMQELQTLSKTYKFKVFVLALGFPDFVRDVCNEFRFRTIKVFPHWLEYTRKQGIADQRAAWQLTEKDPHPTIMGHHVIATTIFNELEKGDYLKKLQDVRLQQLREE